MSSLLHLDSGLSLPSHGVLILDSKAESIQYVSPVTEEWFPGVFKVGGSLAPQFKDFNSLVAVSAAKGSGSATWILEAKPTGRRSFPVEARVSSGSPDVFEKWGIPVGSILVQLSDYSRVKEKEFMLRSFSSVIDENNRRIRFEKKKVDDLLNSMRQAVFATDFDGKVIDPVSGHSKEVFGDEIGGKNVFDFLYASLKDQGDLLSKVKSAFVAVAGEDEIQWKISEKHFPTRVRFERHPEDQRNLRVSTLPIWDSDEGTCQHLLFVVEDVTEVERLEKAIFQEKQKSHQNLLIIQELASLDKTVIETFFSAANKDLQRVHSLIEELSSAREISTESTGREVAEKVNQIFRLVHTLKGNSRTLRLSEISQLTHELEQELDKIRESKGLEDQLLSGLRGRFTALRGRLVAYAELARKVFGIEDSFKQTLLLEILDLGNQFEVALDGFSSADSVEVQQELIRLSHRLKAGSRSLHAMKGLARIMDQESEVDRIHQLESHIQLLLDRRFDENHTPDRLVIQIRQEFGAFMHKLKPALLQALGPVAPNAVLEAYRVISSLLDDLQVAAGERARSVSLWHQASANVYRLGFRSLAALLDLGEKLEAEGDDQTEVRLAVKGWVNWIKQLLFPNPTSLPVSLIQTLLEADGCPAIQSKLEDPLLLELVSVKSLQTWFSRLERLSRVGELTTGASRLSVGYSLIALDVIRGVQSLQSLGGSIVSSDAGPGEVHRSAMPHLVPVVEVALQEVSAYLSAQAEGKVLERKVMALPLGVVFSRFETMVGDIARSLGKLAHFSWDGGDVLLDRRKQESLQEALLHLLRNSLDHGLEPVSERRSKGKPETGKVQVKAVFPDSGDDFLRVDVRDDGRGISTEKLVQKAMKMGLLNEESSRALTESQKLKLIFTPGLSTAESVTTLSGRGVGMDVVRHSIERIAGRLEVQSEEGSGTCISLFIPL